MGDSWLGGFVMRLVDQVARGVRTAVVLIGVLVVIVMLLRVYYNYAYSGYPSAGGIRSRVMSDLRSMQTALESYRVDHGAFPTSLVQLTTPTAYVSSVFEDPYAIAKYRRFLGMPRLSEELALEPQYRMNSFPEREEVWLYSLGPEGVDHRGEFVYDPTNGTYSGGNIVRVVRIEGDVAPAALSPEN